jgi:hypothetical protein
MPGLFHGYNLLDPDSVVGVAFLAVLKIRSEVSRHGFWRVGRRGVVSCAALPSPNRAGGR